MPKQSPWGKPTPEAVFESAARREEAHRKLFDLLNAALKDEKEATHMYDRLAAMFSFYGYQEIAKRITDIEQDEYNHSRELSTIIETIKRHL